MKKIISISAIVLWLIIGHVGTGFAFLDGIRIPAWNPPIPEDRIEWIDRVAIIECTQFKISNLEVKKTGRHSLAISGGVNRINYKLKTWQQGYKNQPCYTDDVNGRDCSGYSFGTRNEQTFKKSWIPAKVLLSSPYCKDDIKADVSPRGWFIFHIDFNKKYYTRPFPRYHLPSKYFGISCCSGKGFTIKAIGFPEPSRIKGSNVRHGRLSQKIPYEAYLIRPLKNKIEDYMRGLNTTIHLSIKDRITHRPLSPLIRITCQEAPTKEKLQVILHKEFNNKKLAIREASKVTFPSYSRFFYKEGRVKETTNEFIKICTMIGAKFKIETIHEDYHYFKGYIAADNSPEIKKDILLIEKGEKVRFENVNEGQGGILTDG